MSEERKLISIKEWPKDKVLWQAPDMAYEAAIIGMTTRGERPSFIDDSGYLSSRREDMRKRFRAHQDIVFDLLDKRDAYLEDKEELESFLSLDLVTDSKSKLFHDVFIMSAEYASDIDTWTKDLLIERMTSGWQKILVLMHVDARDEEDLQHEMETADGNDLEAMMKEYESLQRSLDLDDLGTVVNIIMKSNNDDDVKVKLIALQQKRREMFSKAADFFLTIMPDIAKLIEALSDEIKKIQAIVDTEEEWSKMLHYISSFLDIDIRSEVKMSLRPTVVRPNGFSMNYSRSGEVDLALGLYFLDIAIAAEETEEAFDAIIDGAKLLSDPSRLRILLLLQRGPMYLKEIADHLELTSATCSHHMQNLLNHELIRIDVKKKSRRVYYSLRKDSFDRLGFLITSLGQTQDNIGDTKDER